MDILEFLWIQKVSPMRFVAHLQAACVAMEAKNGD
jgi:hypothetical protein